MTMNLNIAHASGIGLNWASEMEMLADAIQMNVIFIEQNGQLGNFNAMAANAALQSTNAQAQDQFYTGLSNCISDIGQGATLLGMSVAGGVLGDAETKAGGPEDVSETEVVSEAVEEGSENPTAKLQGQKGGDIEMDELDENGKATVTAQKSSAENSSTTTSDVSNAKGAANTTTEVTDADKEAAAATEKNRIAAAEKGQATQSRWNSIYAPAVQNIVKSGGDLASGIFTQKGTQNQGLAQFASSIGSGFSILAGNLTSAMQGAAGQQQAVSQLLSQMIGLAGSPV